MRRDFTVSGLARGILKSRVDIGALQVREVRQYLFDGHPACEQLEDLAHSDPHAANGGLAAADVRLYCDAINRHNLILTHSKIMTTEPCGVAVYEEETGRKSTEQVKPSTRHISGKAGEGYQAYSVRCTQRSDSELLPLRRQGKSFVISKDKRNLS